MRDGHDQRSCSASSSFLLIANAAYRVGLVCFHDQQFKDAVQ